MIGHFRPINAIRPTLPSNSIELLSAVHQKMARLETNCQSHNANKQLARMNGKADLSLAAAGPNSCVICGTAKT